jgi:hypothetical protein
VKTAIEIALEKVEALDVIPRMTDPMGQYWEQPNRRDIEVDDKYALMSQKTFNALAEYSCSAPTGMYAGKMWKTNQRGTNNWWLCWYQDNPDPKLIDTKTRRIIVA